MGRTFISRYVKLVLFALTIVFLTACGTGGATSSSTTNHFSRLPEQVELYYIYEEICGSCDGTSDFYEIVNKYLDNSYPHDVFTINIFETGGQQRYDSICQELGLDSAVLELPLLIVGGKTYQGLDSIEKNIREAYLTAGEDLFENQFVYNPKHKKTGAQLFADFKAEPGAVTLVYFYRIVCDECNETKLVLDAMPTTVEIDSKQTPVNIIRINTRSGNNSERIQSFFEAYHVPDQDRTVPIVFTASDYYAGLDSISNRLPSEIARTENLEFHFP